MVIEILHVTVLIVCIYFLEAFFPIVHFKFWDDRPHVWVVEDSAFDIMLYKSQIDSKKYRVRYFTSLRMVRWHLIFTEPDAVIVDYRLPGISGDKLFQFCHKNGTPSVIVTGCEDKIFGVHSENIIIKKIGLTHFSVVAQWLETNLITH